MNAVARAQVSFQMLTLLKKKSVTRSFDVFFDLRLNKRLSKQSRHWRFETPTRSLWRHRNNQEYLNIVKPLLT